MKKRIFLIVSLFVSVTANSASVSCPAVDDREVIYCEHTSLRKNAGAAPCCLSAPTTVPATVWTTDRLPQATNCVACSSLTTTGDLRTSFIFSTASMGTGKPAGPAHAVNESTSKKPGQ